MTHSVDCGAIYVAFGYEYLLMAANSARSLTSVCPDVRRTVVTNQPVERPEMLRDFFDDVIVLDMPDQLNRLVKTSVVEYCQASRNVFLDCDTEIHGDLSAMFDVLDRFDVVARMDYKPQKKVFDIDDGLASHDFPDWNTAVVFFNDSDQVRTFFAAWHAAFCQANMSTDQPAFSKAVYATGVRVLGTNAVWNTFRDDLPATYTIGGRSLSRVDHYRHPRLDPGIARRVYSCHLALKTVMRQDAVDIAAMAKLEHRYKILTSSWYRHRFPRRIGLSWIKWSRKLRGVPPLALDRSTHRAFSDYPSVHS